MSYDIELQDPNTGKTINFAESHSFKGGTFALGGTTEAWLNVTYNYAPVFCWLLGHEGIRTIYGMTGAVSIPVLEEAVTHLKDDSSNDYWEPTEGNVKKALLDLIELAKMAPAAVWHGD